MSSIRSRFSNWQAQSQEGFTLIELVVVIAILGILVAIAVPVVSGYLSASKQQAYIADQKMIQVAADGYFASPDNPRYQGKRQYPTVANLNAGIVNALHDLVVFGSTEPIEITGTTSTNPIGGTGGGFPIWLDRDGDGMRRSSDVEPLYLPDANVEAEDQWKAEFVTLSSGRIYVIDTRDYLIAFDELVKAGLLEEAPRSASADHGGTGSYSWFVDTEGKVRSLYFFYPTLENQGYQNVFP